MAMKLCSHWLGTARRQLVAAASLMLLATLPVLAAEHLTVTVDKAKVLRLQRDAATVMVANPTIADVVVESPRMIFILGIEPGETSLHIFDARGNEILEAALVVVPNSERQVTINRPNVEETLSCSPRCAVVATRLGSGEEAATGGGDDEDGGGDEVAAPSDGTTDDGG